MNKKIVGAVIVIILMASFWTWRQFNESALPVWVSPVSRGDVAATVANTRAGTVKACRRSNLSMTAGGVVDRLLVKEGDRVEQEQLLLELWNDDLVASVAQAERMLKARQHERQQACLLADFRRREAERKKTLLKRELTSEESVDNAVTEADSQHQICEVARNQEGVAQANLALQRAHLEQTRLRAPFAGIVAEINGEVGEYVTPSPPGIVTPPAVDLIDYSCLYVTAPIDEIDASQIRVGLPVIVTLDAFRGRQFSGKVVRIAPYVTDIEKQARTVEVEVRLTAIPEEVALLVGYSADITVVLEQKTNVLRIPTEAILSGNRVWVLDMQTHKLHLRSLTTGIGNWTYTEVLEGLAEGEQVVRSPDTAGIAEGVEAVPHND